MNMIYFFPSFRQGPSLVWYPNFLDRDGTPVELKKLMQEDHLDFFFSTSAASLSDLSSLNATIT